MSQQGNLFSPGAAPTAVAEPQSSARIPVWLRVIELILFVVLRVYVGILVLLLPWSAMWRDNAFFHHWPALAAIASLGAVRGMVSGLGLLNLWIAVTETFRRSFRS